MIEVVLLDLGNVLVHFSHLPIAQAFSRCASVERYRDPQEVIHYLFKGPEPAEDPFDEGRISPHEFYGRISLEMGLKISFGEFSLIWNSIFTERPGASELVASLKGRVGLHLLSNTNVLHFEHCLRQFPWLHLFDSWFLSYELGRKKPHPDVYRKVVEALDCSPERIVYFDDIEENLRPASSLGMKTVRVDPERSLEELIEPWMPRMLS